MNSACRGPSECQGRNLKSLLECSICLETFDDPRTLSCLHSFCKKCLEDFVHGKPQDELNCPVCRTKFTLNEGGVAGMTRNHFICNMVEVLSTQHQGKSIPCSHCEQPSVGRCVTCELFMCEPCLLSHNGYVGFRDHLVLTLEELSKPENLSKIKKISKCNQHPKKKLKYYCETCYQLICRHCMEFDHDKKHRFSPLEKAAQDKREALKKHCEMLENAVTECAEESILLKERSESLNSNFDVMKRFVNERREQLLGRLEEAMKKKTDSMTESARIVIDRKTGDLTARINSEEASANHVKASLDMALSLLQNGDDEDIVCSYQSVKENVDSAKRSPVRDESVNDNFVLPWKSNEIDAILFAEIERIIKKDKQERAVSKLLTREDLLAKAVRLGSLKR